MNMYNTNIIADDLHHVYYGDNWTDVSIAATLKDIGYQQATKRTDASANTIAALVNHLWFWNTIVLQRMNGEDPPIPEENGMDVKPVNDEQDWQALIQKLGASFDELIDAVRKVRAEELEVFVKNRTTSIGFNLMGIVEHAHYHLGQIVLLKKLLSTTR